MNQQMLIHNVGDDVYELIEQLYDSKNAINEQRINEIALSLCHSFAIDTDILEGGLCVAHKRVGRSDHLPTTTKNERLYVSHNNK